ncbi:GntR family transcriptional regulator [Staphylococcus felis]|uniref:GntR family transcriptional regulator n=1 Tax=Staphylococcus felis TaxID=46127 RepID=UPI000CD30042|nr:GntR family transcriptional regulator [Staphylococcus felis]AVP37545.1 GntR family transcriptional regulator [Staphylococcus felis]PNZ37654.1 GntR family transcriptional regulator [Staphylococcus felis]QQB02507.1 GntR family transcriptional regulator [Staphylococcus felis]REH75002.1 GntR family transcriptional regulator [Staphylococcus felis]REI06007.1 GntR family transcriptional regulator [Staphylococcus felis]
MDYPKEWQVHLSKGERIAAVLRLNIINGEMDQHRLITENQIADRFKVSRSPVRDAFKILSQERLIRLERMGAEIIPFNEEKRQELSDIRLMIEAFAFTKIVERNDIDMIIKNMLQSLEIMRVSVQFEDATRFATEDLRFHEVMVEACEHSYLMHIWQQMKPIMLCLIYISMKERMETNRSDFERILDNHQQFIEAIKAKDRHQMYEAFKANFNDINNNIGAFWS